jgi:hypothetical protein
MEMTKKIAISVLAALVLSLVAGLAASNQVLAQGAGPLGRLLRARPVLGQVTAIGKSDFSVEKKDGTELTFQVDESTRYRSKDKAELAFADLKTGQWVAVVTGRRLGMRDLARMVVTLPEDLDPTQFEGARGEVVEVNPAANQFTLENPQGEKTVVTVDAETVYRGQVASLTDIKEGMQAGVISKETTGDGLVARIVRAGDRSDLPVADLWIGGKIVSLEKNAFTIENRDGKQYTFQTDSDTRIRSREQRSLADLKTGMAVLVGAKDLGNGSYQALVIEMAPRR